MVWKESDPFVEVDFPRLADTFWIMMLVASPGRGPNRSGLPPKVGFLSNIVKIFPSLAKRPFCLAGESYAGTYARPFSPSSCQSQINLISKRLSWKVVYRAYGDTLEAMLGASEKWRPPNRRQQKGAHLGLDTCPLRTTAAGIVGQL
ncbi:hypothetical protein B0H14DRAFT_2658372 [Mycena olivaceomarginata]|nr:hypothetical protein B0H14DRAFT_2658372 [Mycena olivaceomarginata]